MAVSPRSSPTVRAVQGRPLSACGVCSGPGPASDCGLSYQQSLQLTVCHRDATHTCTRTHTRSSCVTPSRASGARVVTGLTSRGGLTGHTPLFPGTFYSISLAACPHEDKGSGVLWLPEGLLWPRDLGWPGQVPARCTRGMLAMQRCQHPSAARLPWDPSCSAHRPSRRWAACVPWTSVHPTVPGFPGDRAQRCSRWMVFSWTKTWEVIRLAVTDELSTSSPASSRPWETHRKTI